jgi:hypothetical protein
MRLEGNLKEFSVEELVSRLSGEQLKDTLGSVTSEIRQETGKDVDLGQVISSIVEDVIRKKRLTLAQYARKPSVAKTDEEIAVETVWRILNPPIEKKSYRELIGDILDIIWPKWKKPPKITVVEVGTLPPENLEVLKELVKKAALRKLKELDEKEAARRKR